MAKDGDYAVDEKMKTATLTDLGVKRIEKAWSTNLYESFDTIHHAEQALRAKTLFNRDKDYIVKDGEVIIVDEHTGRLMYGRRYSDVFIKLLKQKKVCKFSRIKNTCNNFLANYFRLYKKLQV